MLDKSQSTANLLLSIATTPMILTFMALNTITDALIEMGQTSEEVFRGERLPILNLSEKENNKLK
jgi:hypothetical protein